MSLGASPSFDSMSNFPGGFASGVTIQGLPILNTHGSRVFWVDSVNGSDGNRGTFSRPFASISGALTVMASPATTVSGDIIMCKPGHAETITAANGINLNQAGLTVVGLGNDALMPTITFTTSTAATFKLGAAQVRVRGLRFVCSIASQVTMIDVQAKGCSMMGCEFVEGTATPVSFLACTASANAADRFIFSGNRIYSPTTGNVTQALALNTVQDNWEISGNDILANASLSCIHNVTGNVATQLKIDRNYVRNLSSSGYGIRMISAVTGHAYDNRVFTATLGNELSATSMHLAGNMASNTAGQAGRSIPDNDFSEKCVQGAIKALPASTTQTIFTISGGPVEIIDVFGEVTTVVQTQACNFKYSVVDTVTSTTTDISANLNITAAAVGAFLTLNTTLAGATLKNLGGTGIKNNAQVRAPVGNVIVTTDATNTGNIRYQLRYRPLAPGATVVAA